MNKATAKHMGRTAGKLLLERLAKARILDDLYSRIVATMPTVVQEAQAADSSLSPMFQATARHYAMCFACARLAFNASTIFAERPWREFIEGVLESAVDNTGLDQPDDEMRYLATRADIIENINDHEKALARLCGHYPPEAKQVLIDIADRMEPIVSDVLAGVESEHHITTTSLVMFLILFLFCLGATLLIGFAFPVFLITTLVLGLVGFRMGKSTKVPANPRDVPFSPMLTLSYREFDRWARQKDLRRTDPAFFSRTDVHWTEKLPVLFSGSNAAGHCFEPGRSTTKILFADLALGAFIFFPAIRDSFDGLSNNGAIFFQFLCGLALSQVAGRATGNFYRWIRGQMHRTMGRGLSDRRIINFFVQKNFQIYRQTETVPPMQIQMIKGLIEWMAYPPKPDRTLSSALDNQIFVPYPITAGNEGLLKRAIPELLVYLAGSDADWGGESAGDYQTIKLIKAKVRSGNLSREFRDALQDTLKMMEIKFEDARNDPALVRRSDQALSLIRETLDEIARVTVVASPVSQSTGPFSIGIATKANNIDEVRRLIKQGADIEALNEAAGATALINASQFGYTKIVKLLLENGANCNAATRKRTTSLHVAANHGHRDIVQMLIDKHADANATDATGATPLLYAVQSGGLEIVKMFLEIKGIDLNRSNEVGSTPLIIASAKGYSEIVKALLSVGADVKCKDWNDSTAYDVSVMNGHKEIAEMLKNCY